MSDQREAFEERAAIIQFSSGLPTMTREQAEKIAAEQMGLTDSAPTTAGHVHSMREPARTGVQRGQSWRHSQCGTRASAGYDAELA